METSRGDPTLKEQFQIQALKIQGGIDKLGSMVITTTVKCTGILESPSKRFLNGEKWNSDNDGLHLEHYTIYSSVFKQISDLFWPPKQMVLIATAI